MTGRAVHQRIDSVWIVKEFSRPVPFQLFRPNDGPTVRPEDKKASSKRLARTSWNGTRIGDVPARGKDQFRPGPRYNAAWEQSWQNTPLSTPARASKQNCRSSKPGQINSPTM